MKNEPEELSWALRHVRRAYSASHFSLIQPSCDAFARSGIRTLELITTAVNAMSMTMMRSMFSRPMDICPAAYSDRLTAEGLASVPLCTPDTSGRVVQSEIVPRSGVALRYRVMPIDSGDAEARLARIERMIEEYCADQRRQFLQQMSKCRRLAEAHKTNVTPDVPSRLD